MTTAGFMRMASNKRVKCSTWNTEPVLSTKKSSSSVGPQQWLLILSEVMFLWNLPRFKKFLGQKADDEEFLRWKKDKVKSETRARYNRTSRGIINEQDTCGISRGKLDRLIWVIHEIS